MAEFPSGTFGFVPDWLPDLVGRCVMLAALIEVKVDAIVMNLSGEAQATHAGGNVDASLGRARKLVLKRIPETDQDQFLDLLARTGEAL